MSANDDNKPSFFARYIDDQTKEAIKQQRRSVDPVLQWAKTTRVKTFLMDVLTNGPVSMTLIEEQGTALGFSKRQLQRAKERMGIVSFKEKIVGGRWFWAIPQHAPQRPPKPTTAKKPNRGYVRYLRTLSKRQGYRLQLIGK